MRHLHILTSFVLGSLVAACGPAQGPVFSASDGAMPEFSLSDVNPASVRYQQAVSPRDYLAKVSGWYFGHAG
ncbi:MAG: hypothetical protein ABIJ09_16815 [Pseudomonadota bacterium]